MRVKSAQFYWVTREPGSFEWFKGVMNEVAEMDHKVNFSKIMYMIITIIVTYDSAKLSDITLMLDTDIGFD